MGHVLIKHGINGTTALGGLIGQIQQGVDFLVAHVERAAVADEAQAFQVRRAIDPEVARRARSCWQQAFFLLIAHGFYRGLGDLG
jgi:hypothetical protein